MESAGRTIGGDVPGRTGELSRGCIEELSNGASCEIEEEGVLRCLTTRETWLYHVDERAGL